MAALIARGEAEGVAIVSSLTAADPDHARPDLRGGRDDLVAAGVVP